MYWTNLRKKRAGHRREQQRKRRDSTPLKHHTILADQAPDQVPGPSAGLQENILILISRRAFLKKKKA